MKKMIDKQTNQFSDGKQFASISEAVYDKQADYLLRSYQYMAFEFLLKMKWRLAAGN